MVKTWETIRLVESFGPISEQRARTVTSISGSSKLQAANYTCAVPRQPTYADSQPAWDLDLLASTRETDLCTHGELFRPTDTSDWSCIHGLAEGETKKHRMISAVVGVILSLPILFLIEESRVIKRAKTVRLQGIELKFDLQYFTKRSE